MHRHSNGGAAMTTASEKKAPRRISRHYRLPPSTLAKLKALQEAAGTSSTGMIELLIERAYETSRKRARKTKRDSGLK